ncbi:MAG: hypothetical protein E7302_10720 [Butyrivibrio sp.]|nr:hypothetical protein [Butyrivibrio sp.]
MNSKTIKLYDEKPYETEFEATVISCEPSEKEAGKYIVVLDKTLFFPEEGGQTPDKGFIAASDEKAIVSDVQIKGDVIYHETDKPFDVGAKVKGEIDFVHRFSNMQQHSGEHIFSGIVNKKFGYDNVGFHLSDSVVTMDYSGPISKEELAEIELLVNKAIYENVPINAEYPSKEELEKIDYRSKKELIGDVRIVTVEGYDVCACCAPHVRTTGEIGILKVITSQNYKGGTRVSILCGRRALEYLAKEHDMITELANDLSTSWESIPDQFKKQQDEIAQLKRALSDAGEKILESEIQKLPESIQNVCLFADKESDPNVVRRSVNKLVQTREGYCGIFWGNDTEGYRFIIGCRQGMNSNDILNELKKKYQVRGGGAPAMVQGSLTGAGEDDIRNVFENHNM